MATLSVQVGASTDDAQQQHDGTNFNNNSIGVRFSSGTTASTAYIAGLRFTNVTIPAGATINSASLQLFMFASDDDILCDIYCEDADNPGTFSGSATGPSSRTLTAAATAWDATNVSGSTDAWVTAPDISAAVQEVVDRAGWASGNALVVLLKGRVSATVRSSRTHTWDYDTTKAPKLDIVYSTGGGGGLSIPVAMATYRTRRS